MDNPKPLDQAQIDELQRLATQDITFTLPVLRRSPLRKPHTVTHTLTLRQPTLATLDRIAPLMQQLAPAIQQLTNASGNNILALSKLALAKSSTLALILAHLILGEDYYTYNPLTRRYTPSHRRLRRLHRTLLHSATPSLMLQICNAALTVCNLVDFIASIRLLAAETETASGRIE